MAVQTQIQARRGTAATWTSTNPTLAAGEMGFETDTGKFKIGTGSAAWTALGYAGGGQNTLSTYVYTATSGQTTFSGADSNGNTLSYTVGAIQVYLNGALLTPTSDFTASTGTSVVLVTGALTSDTLTVLALGSFTVSTDIAKSTLSTKGDILTATAASTPAVLAVGADGSSIVADSAATTGLRYSPAPAIGNPILNSAYQVWQRNTSATYTGASNQYTGADRWSYLGSAGSSATISRQVTGDTTNLPNIQYCARYLRTAGNTDTNTLYFAQTFETINTYQFAGKTITLSFYARKGANYSAASSYLAANLAYGTGTDQALNGGAAANNIVTQQNVLTSTWQRFTVSAAVPTAATQLVAMFTWAGVGTAGAADYYEITGVQIDQGSVALPFRTYAATIQGELAACQRYFLKYGGNQAYETFPGVLLSYSTTQGEGPIALKSTMRTTPTVAFSTLKISDVASYNLAVTNLTITTNTSGPDAAYLVFTVASGASSGKTNLLRTDGSTAGYLTFSAEL